jgi:hypothetical protein
MTRTFPVSIRRANAADHAARLACWAWRPNRRQDSRRRSILPSVRAHPHRSVDPRSVIELALVHRLASLFWRLHRASAIETGLFEIQSEVLLARGEDPSLGPSQAGTLTPIRATDETIRPPAIKNHCPSPCARRSDHGRSPTPQCFLRLSHLDPTLLDRVGGYEARLWRQAVQTIWTLKAMRQPPPPMRQRLRHRIPPLRPPWFTA